MVHIEKSIGNEGLFLSHGYMGTFLFCLGLWWWIRILRRLCTSLKRSEIQYTTSASYGSICCRHTLGEGLFKLAACIIGFGVEAITVSLGRHFDYAHYPFYASVLLSGVLDIMTSTIFIAPEGLDYMALALPFFMQTYCFRAQAFMQPHLTETCRLLTSYWGFCVGLAILAEMLIPNSFLWSWFKCFAILLQGTWIFQTSLLLSPPGAKGWAQNDHDNVMYAAIIFCWHMFAIVVLQTVLLLIMGKCYGVIPDWLPEPIFRPVRRLSFNSQSRMTVDDRIQYTKLLNGDSPDE